MNLSKGLTHIQEQISPDSFTKDCGGEGCQVYRTGLPRKRLVINVEKEFDARGDSSKRCDRLLFYENTGKNAFIAVTIELKSGKAKESDVRKKLENSLNFAANIASESKVNGNIIYVPVLFNRRGINWTNPRRRELRVNFQGKSIVVFMGRCGIKRNLATVLSDAKVL